MRETEAQLAYSSYRRVVYRLGTMTKESLSNTLEQAIQIADQLSLADRGTLFQHLQMKAGEDFQRLQKKAREDFEATKNQIEQSMQPFGVGSSAAYKTTSADKQERAGPCPICKFETIPHHDGRKHKFQGKGQGAPFTEDQMKELGYIRKKPA
jgi:hypothetical protein